MGGLWRLRRGELLHEVGNLLWRRREQLGFLPAIFEASLIYCLLEQVQLVSCLQNQGEEVERFSLELIEILHDADRAL